MLRLTVVLSCCCLISCGSDVDNKPAGFKERQAQLFYEIDHQAVYDGCQELMRRHRNGTLSASTFYCDDPPAKRDELPEPIHSLRPTYVSVDEMMVTVGFFSEDGTQSLQCFSNEFGEPSSSPGEPKGLGFRTNPYGMDRLSGEESLDYLNENYAHFTMQLFPGLSYQVFGDDHPASLEEAKESVVGTKAAIDFMMEAMNELIIKRQRLLHRTDHHELLKACRLIMQRHNDGVFSAATIHIIPGEFKEELKDTLEYQSSIGNLEHIPEIILNLEPCYISFLENRVMVALSGGLDHAGVVAYEDSQDALLGDDDMKLIDGLLYYDDGLREADEDYREYLKSLENEAIPYLDWKRKQMNLPIPERATYRTQESMSGTSTRR